MAGLRIIVLDHDDRNFNYLVWAAVPTARQPFYADANKVSAWKGALAADNADLQMGRITETAHSISMPEGAKYEQVLAEMVSVANLFQTKITDFNPWDRYGTTWDGTSWTAGGVA